MKIGIALSGGGYRAAAFHFGVLARLAKSNLLEEFSFISTVSGGTVATALVYRSNEYKWPTSEHYLRTTIPLAHSMLTSANLQKRVLRDILVWPFRLFASRAPLIARRIRTQMGIDININQLAEDDANNEDLTLREPRWIINTTCYESGANFRFERRRMGDYKIGYSDSPAVPLCDAIAASAGFPVLVGPLTLATHSYDWYEYDKETGQRISKNKERVPEKLHLWDGGVYDNLGLEALVNYDSKKAEYAYRKGVDYLIISNASGEQDFQDYKPGVGAIVRLISIPKYQVESLRSRDALHRFLNHQQAGRYFDTDNYCQQVLKNAKYSEQQLKQLCEGYLGRKDAERAARIQTEIKNLTHEEFELLFRQGFEVADCTLHAFESGSHHLMGFDQDYWLSLFKS